MIQNIYHEFPCKGSATRSSTGRSDKQGWAERYVLPEFLFSWISAFMTVDAL